MKPNSSWSLRQNDNAPGPLKPSGGGGAHGSGGGKDATPLLERRICWFITRTAEKRAGSAELATGLGLTPEEARGMTKAMVRKGILRELVKSADRPHAQFAVTPRFLQEATALAAGPDPATL
jgi:hypothetical protein